MEILAYLIAAVIAYLLGSIPTGYLVARAKGIDIRSVGSGNIGATNAFRVLGKGAGTFVLIADALKGWLAVAICAAGVPTLMHIADNRFDAAIQILMIVGALGAILGHNYTCWLRFKGGKGIATTAGVLLALMPKSLAVALSTWIVVALLSRYVSVASITAAAMLPVATWWFGYNRTLFVVSALMGGLAIFKHKTNIQRLLNGTENRIGSKKTAAAKGEAQ